MPPTIRRQADSTAVIKAESDYYPWGGELEFVNNDSNDYKFTSKKRDLETGLDYFGARYYSNALGRWVSADWSALPVPVPYADFNDPQSLNLYEFVGGNPASNIDQDGHSPLWWQKLRNKLRYGHAVADSQLEAALKNDATTALSTLTGHNVIINGKPVAEALNGKTNKQVVDAFNRIDAQLTLQHIMNAAATIPVSATNTLNEIDKTGSAPQGQQVVTNSRMTVVEVDKPSLKQMPMVIRSIIRSGISTSSNPVLIEARNAL